LQTDAASNKSSDSRKGKTEISGKGQNLPKADQTDSLRANLKYEPRELKFGTSGRRGKAVDLTQLPTPKSGQTRSRQWPSLNPMVFCAAWSGPSPHDMSLQIDALSKLLRQPANRNYIKELVRKDINRWPRV